MPENDAYVKLPVDVLDKIDRALTEATTTSLMFGPALDEPYPDDPRWSPRTRFLDPMGRRALAARDALRKARADAR